MLKKLKRMRAYLQVLSLIIMSQLCFGISSFAANLPCFKFELNQVQQNQLKNAQEISHFTFYPSRFQYNGKKNSYFVDYGVKQDPEAYILVSCDKVSANYISCTAEAEAAKLGLYQEKGTQHVKLHITQILMSYPDEPEVRLKPKKGSFLSIKGQTFECPKKSPEDTIL